MKRMSRKNWDRIQELNKIGLETLTLLRFCAFHIDEKNKNKPNELYKILDLIGQYHDHKIKAFEDVLKLKLELYGKEYLIECMNLTIKLYEKCDIDIFQALGINKNTLPQLTELKDKMLE